MNTPLINFYINGARNNRGYTLQEMIEADNHFWEGSYFIQWVFPTDKPSRSNPDAPILDEETIYKLKTSEVFENNFKDSLYRFNVFLAETDWCQPANPNLLKIGRALYSMRLLGFVETANIWQKLYERKVIETLGPQEPCLNYWRNYEA